MSETISGTVEIQNSLQPPKTLITLSGDEGTALFGEKDDNSPSTLLGSRRLSIGRKPRLPSSKPALGGSLVKSILDKVIDLDSSAAVADNPFQPRILVLVGDEDLAGGIAIVGKEGKTIISLNGATGTLTIGSQGHDGEISILDKTGNLRIHLDGDNGDIELMGADCAEEFDLEGTAVCVEPGCVMVIGNEGGLRPCQQAYDRCVAGVISGAGTYRPGIILHKDRDLERRVPLALTGKVFCKVDASFGVIEMGDMLTTSPTPGYAMKALDPARAFGAILGKALQPLNAGQGLLPVLVALQ